MILNTGSRTDIPAFFSDWFYRRVREGYVLVRSPYAPEKVTRYRLDPEVVDLLVFGTKNPAPMLPRLHELSAFATLWHVTVTPYGKDIEPGVPDKARVIDSVRALARAVGPERVVWRYDPIFLSEKYTLSFHLEAFARMAAALEGAAGSVAFSFIDLYEKTRRNFPEVRSVPREAMDLLCEGIAREAARRGMTPYSCLEGEAPARWGIRTSGCLSREAAERALGEELSVPSYVHPAREGCRCLLGSDIGVYNTCRHFCRYCYANYDRTAVLRSAAAHDASSPLLIGRARPEDVVTDARQESWRTGQLTLGLGEG